jgi:hypothetical protein
MHRARRSGLAQAVFWLAAGGATLYASWTMDRLEKVGVQAYSAPGLLPGILGLLIMALGAAMLARALRAPRGDALPAEPVAWRRLLPPVGLCLAYAGGLVGRVPFWLASWLFVATMIGLLQYRERREKGELARLALVAGSIGLGAALAVSLIFERLFLIRLP